MEGASAEVPTGQEVDGTVYLRVADLLDAVWADGDDRPGVLGDGDAVVLTLLDDVLADPPRRRHVPLVDGSVRAAADQLDVVVRPDDRPHAVVVTLKVDEQVVSHRRVDLDHVALHGGELVTGVTETALSNHHAPAAINQSKYF